METHTCVAPAGERPTLRAKIGRIISRSKYSADAVASRHRVERPVELASAETDRNFERSPRPLDLRQLVCNSHEHDVGRLTHNDVFCVHAVDVTALLPWSPRRENHSVRERSRMAPDTAEDCLDGSELGRWVEPTIEDKAAVFAVSGDDVLPSGWQAVWGIDAKEVAQGGLAESVEVFMRPE